MKSTYHYNKIKTQHTFTHIVFIFVLQIWTKFNNGTRTQKCFPTILLKGNVKNINLNHYLKTYLTSFITCRYCIFKCMYVMYQTIDKPYKFWYMYKIKSVIYYIFINNLFNHNNMSVICWFFSTSNLENAYLKKKNVDLYLY